MENYDIYPAKPHIEKVKIESNWGLTAFSLVLFVGVFLLLFKDEINFVLFLILVLFIHEMGHFTFMKLFNYENVRMLFIPLMGAFVQGSKEKYSQTQSFIVVAAGPFPGICIGIITLFISSFFQLNWILELSFLFLFLNIINLIPIDPLDGGQLFKLLVHKKRDLFLIIFAFISSLILILVGFLIWSWVTMIFGFFMGIRVRGIQRNYQIRKLLDEQDVNYISTYDDLSNRDYAKIKDIIIAETPSLKKFLTLSDEQNDDVLASHVNSVLLAPVKYDAPLWLKFIIVASWLILVFFPLFLLIFYRHTFLDWYFETI
jgi:stage IV sporulation protein FB